MKIEKGAALAAANGTFGPHAKIVIGRIDIPVKIMRVSDSGAITVAGLRGTHIPVISKSTGHPSPELYTINEETGVDSCEIHKFAPRCYVGKEISWYGKNRYQLRPWKLGQTLQNLFD